MVTDPNFGKCFRLPIGTDFARLRAGYFYLYLGELILCVSGTPNYGRKHIYFEIGSEPPDKVFWKDGLWRGLKREQRYVWSIVSPDKMNSVALPFQMSKSEKEKIEKLRDECFHIEEPVVQEKKVVLPGGRLQKIAYTIGHEDSYDSALEKATTESPVFKIGQRKDCDGGCVYSTIESAIADYDRVCSEFEGDGAIYKIKLPWGWEFDVDEKTQLLLSDAKIVRKVKTANQLKGLRDKYIVERTDGKEKPDAKYFVLDYVNDPHAKEALKKYIESCKEDYPVLARDLKKQLE